MAGKNKNKNAATGIAAYPFRYVARVVIELDTPLHIGSGREGAMADAAIVTDANGLAAIPGDTLAGVLRTAFSARYGDRAAYDLFGGKDADGYRGSRLSVSWAAVHHRHNSPVTGIAGPDRLRDPVLQSALVPEHRDHVRLSHRGAVADKDAAAGGRALFSQYCLCRGHRFTFEVELIGKGHEGKQGNCWAKLLALLNARDVRFGGKSRRGFGAFRVLEVSNTAFNLKDENDYAAYADHPADLAHKAETFTVFQPGPSPACPSGILTLKLPLAPRSYWMFGGGDDEHTEGMRGDADMAPVRAPMIVWVNDLGRVEEQVYYLPGSAIKGAIAHRVAYHYNLLAGNFAEDIVESCPNEKTGFQRADELLDNYIGEKNEAVRQLFGARKRKKDDPEAANSQRGRIMIDDIYLAEPPPSQLIPHAPLDRFSGGTRNLFSERPFWQGPIINLEIVLLEKDRIGFDSRRSDAAENLAGSMIAMAGEQGIVNKDDKDYLAIARNVRRALYEALKDLAEGRLQLGAGAGRGLGYFERTDPDWAKPLLEWIDEVPE